MRLHLPPSEPLPGITIRCGELVLAPRRWEDLVAEPERVRWGDAVERQTVNGWPLRLVEAEGAGEVWLCACYSFLEHAAVAIASAATRAQLEAHGKALLAILERGRPDWRGLPVCLAEAWDLELEPAVVAIQDLYSRGRHGEGEAARAAFRRTARLLSEYVFDRFDAHGFSVRAIETLRPASGFVAPVVTFRAAHASLVIETSDHAAQAGTPLVVAVVIGTKYRVVAAMKELPPYAELKQLAAGFLAEALR